MATERIKLFEADIDVDGIVKKSGELRDAINAAKDAMVIAGDQTGKSSAEYIKAEANVKKLSAEFRVNQQQIINLTNSSGELLTVEQKLTTALDKEVKSIENAVDNNKELRKIRNSVNAETVEGQKAIADINKKIDENTAFIKTNTDSYSQQKMEIGDYKTAIKEAYDELNIFNGGIIVFVQRAQAAGGVMPMLKNGLTAITQGIWGATKASLAFIVTPIGAVIAAIGVVLGALIYYLKSTQAGIDAVTAVTRPLSAIFQTLIGILQQVGEYLFKAFSNPKKAITEVYDFVKDKVMKVLEGYWKLLSGIATLNFTKAKEGLADLNEATIEGINAIKNAAGAIGDTFAEAYKKGQRIDELQKQFEQREIDIIAYRAEQEIQLKKLENIQKNQLLSSEQRVKAIEDAERISKELLARENEILDIQIEQLKIKQSLNDTSREEEKALQELIAQRIKNEAIVIDVEKRALGAKKQLHNEEVNAAKQAQAEKIAAAEKAFDASIKKQQLELQLYLESQGIKKRTMAEELKLAEEASAKLIDIERQKLARRKITEEEFKLFVIQSEKSLALQRVEIAAENLDLELEQFKKNHQAKLEAGTFFSEAAYQQEQERLAALLAQEQEYWAKKLELGVINQTEYNAAIDALNEENRLALEEARLERVEAEKEKQAIDLENKRAAQIENLEYDLEFQLAELEAKRQLEIEQAEKTGADLALIDEKYAKLREETNRRVEENRLALASQTAGNLATIMGKESALGKAMAITQTTIDTYRGATAAYASLATLVPYGPVLGGIAAAAAVAAGLANVKKIASTKPPKAEKGMALNIGGRRHAQGGTKFYGEDGTHFEAEAGEKMFILNRQASAALAPLLSDINQQYGGVSLSRASSYLAAGGQVYRSVAQQVDSATNLEMMREAIREGSIEGTMRGSMEGSLQGSRLGSMEGSSKGTYSGIVDKETNETIAAGANF